MSHFHLESIGWMIVHSVWQFLLITLIAWFLADVILRRHAAAIRYWVFGAALVLMLLSPIASFYWLIETPDANLTATTQIEVPEPIMLHDHNIVIMQTESEPNAVAQQAIPVPAAAAAAADVAPAITTEAVPETTQSWLKLAVKEIRPWLNSIVIIWCLGVVCCSLKLSMGWARVWQIKSRGRQVTDSALINSLQAAIQKLQVRRPVQMLVSDCIQSPVVLGVLKSVILIPVSFLGNVSQSHVEAILAHELAHVRRHDYLINLIQLAIETLFFYHPAIWWVSHRMRTERENACDDLAAKAIQSPAAYSRALVALEELRGRSLSPALGASDGALLARIQRLFLKSDNSNSLTSNWGAIALLASMCCMGLFLIVPNMGSKEAALSDISELTGPRFMVETTDGISVELVAVRPQQEDNQPQQNAWRPDGTEFDKQPKLPATPMTAYAPQDRSLSKLDLYFRYTGLPEKTMPSYVSAGLKTMWPADKEGVAPIVLAPPSESLSGSVTVGIPDREYGPWRKIKPSGELTGTTILKPRYQPAYSKIKPHDVQINGQGSLIRWSHEQTESEIAQLDVVAVDVTGKRHSSSGSTLWDDPDGKTRHATQFNVPEQQLDHYEYRLRPIRDWVTFDHVAFKPDQLTEVTIESNPVPIVTSDNPTISVEGRIVMADGSPATVSGWLYQDTSNLNSQLFSTIGVFTDQFDMKIQPGNTVLLYYPTDFAPTSTDVLKLEQGDVVESVELVLQPGLETQLSIVNAEGNPVKQPVVVAHPMFHGIQGGPVYLHQGDEDGQVNLSHLANTDHTVTIAAPGYETLTAEPIQIHGTSPLTFTMREAATTTGTILDANGQPAVGAKLWAQCEITPERNFNSSPMSLLYESKFPIGSCVATTDEHGRFTLGELTAGSDYMFLIEGLDGTRQIYRDFQPGQRDVQIQLLPRQDLIVELNGDLSSYFNSDDAKSFTISQRYILNVDQRTKEQLVKWTAPIETNETGGNVQFLGLVTDPDAEPGMQKIETSFGTKKSAENRFHLTEFPVTRQTWNIDSAPEPEIPEQIPFKDERSQWHGLTLHTGNQQHWTILNRGNSEIGLKYQHFGNQNSYPLPEWSFRGTIYSYGESPRTLFIPAEQSTVELASPPSPKRKEYELDFSGDYGLLEMTIDNKLYNPEKGRIIVLNSNGDPVQLAIPLPTLEELKNQDSIAQFMDQIQAALPESFDQN